ncbi:MAG: hypothetical protein A6D91_05575 [Bacillaceae bacterium G1]|nr:MAG: hypothetical protein A6D91_05575 [Bacillaceae bacterium G1]
MHFISASRKTDIPAFYMEWFMYRIAEGKAYVYNAYRQEAKAVSLAPDRVGAIVFWSKNYRPALPYLKRLKKMGYRMFFHYTITGQPRLTEKHVAATIQNIKTFRNLAEMFSPEQMHWRFDPIFYTQSMGKMFYIESFERIAQELAGYTKRCSISFVTMYPKVRRKLSRELQEDYPMEVPLTERLKLTAALQKIAARHRIQLYSCCQDELCAVEGVKKGSCVDAPYLSRLFRIPQMYPKRPTRESCGCYESYDIGFYNTCPHGCVYCYANVSHASALRNYKMHRADAPLIVGDVKGVVFKDAVDGLGEKNTSDQLSMFNE